MLLNFRLRPVEKITPWRSEEKLHLSWFGLTDGWYWINVGNDELFRYTDEILSLWEGPENQIPENNYVDYQVVRFWEDLQEMLPEILEPIPKNILQRIEPGNQGLMWRDDVADYLLPDDRDISDSAYDNFETITSWLAQRRLDVGYLQNGPRIWFWCDEQTMYIHWDNTDIHFEGTPVWTARKGVFSLPVPQFIEEIRAFDYRLIQAMQDHVNSICQHWSRPEITIDLKSLVSEQEERSLSMERAFAKTKQLSPTPWADVLRMIEQVAPHA